MGNSIQTKAISQCGGKKREYRFVQEVIPAIEQDKQPNINNRWPPKKNALILVYSHFHPPSLPKPFPHLTDTSGQWVSITPLKADNTEVKLKLQQTALNLSCSTEVQQGVKLAYIYLLIYSFCCAFSGRHIVLYSIISFTSLPPVPRTRKELQHNIYLIPEISQITNYFITFVCHSLHCRNKELRIRHKHLTGLNMHTPHFFLITFPRQHFLYFIQA